MRRFFAVSLAAALACAPVAPPRPARAQLATVCVNCADRIQQLIGHAKDLEHLAETITMRVNQAQMLQNQITNMISLPGAVWHQIEGNFTATQNLFSQGMHLRNSIGFASSQLNSYRGLLGQVINMKDQYGRWSEQANDNVAASLRGFGLMRDQMAGDRAVVDVIRARSSGAEGMKQALQANVEMGGAMVNELHRLREIALEDARQHANALAIEAERRATEEASDTQFYGTPPQPEAGNKRY